MAEISQGIQETLQTLEVFRQAKVVTCYMPLEGEPDLTALFPDFPDKTWLLPRLTPLPEDPGTAHLLFYPYRPGDSLEQHTYGMWEPAANIPAWGAAIDLMLLPGLAFDEAGTRLGYGKGYYDQFIATLPSSNRPSLIGVVADALLLLELPKDPWDIAMNGVVTERRSLFPAKP